MKLRTLTPRGVETLKPGAARYTAWIETRPGLGIRVTPNGAKTFVYAFHRDGFRWMTLGRWPGMTVKAALAAYTDAAALRAVAVDPIKAREREREEERLAEEARKRAAAEERRAETFEQLAQTYLERWSIPRKRTAAEDRRILEHDVLPHWARRKAKDIRRADVLALLDHLRARGVTVGANRTLALVRRVFNWAIEVGLLEASPVVRIRPPAPETRRERFLRSDEAAAFWCALDSARALPQMKAALRLALSTGQRIGEVLGARWAELDLEAGRWELAGARTKAKRAHVVPLSALAVRVLREARLAAGTSEYCFPSPRDQRKAMRVASASRAILENREIFKECGIAEPVTPHDLRRTFATNVAMLGASRLTLIRLLNHADRSTTGIYDRFEGWPQMQKAAQKWSDELERCIAQRRGFKSSEGAAR